VSADFFAAKYCSFAFVAVSSIQFIAPTFSLLTYIIFLFIVIHSAAIELLFLPSILKVWQLSIPNFLCAMPYYFIK